MGTLRVWTPEALEGAATSQGQGEMRFEFSVLGETRSLSRPADEEHTKTLKRIKLTVRRMVEYKMEEALTVAATLVGLVSPGKKGKNKNKKKKKKGKKRKRNAGGIADMYDVAVAAAIEGESLVRVRAIKLAELASVPKDATNREVWVPGNALVIASSPLDPTEALSTAQRRAAAEQEAAAASQAEREHALAAIEGDISTVGGGSVSGGAAGTHAASSAAEGKGKGEKESEKKRRVQLTTTTTAGGGGSDNAMDIVEKKQEQGVGVGGLARGSGGGLRANAHAFVPLASAAASKLTFSMTLEVQLNPPSVVEMDLRCDVLSGLPGELGATFLSPFSFLLLLVISSLLLSSLSLSFVRSFVCLPFTIYHLPFTFYYLPFTIYRLLFTVRPFDLFFCRLL